MKRILVHSLRGKIRKQSITFFDLSWEYALQTTQVFVVLYMPANEHEISTSIILGVTNKF